MHFASFEHFLLHINLSSASNFLHRGRHSLPHFAPFCFTSGLEKIKKDVTTMFSSDGTTFEGDGSVGNKNTGLARRGLRLNGIYKHPLRASFGGKKSGAIGQWHSRLWAQCSVAPRVAWSNSPTTAIGHAKHEYEWLKRRMLFFLVPVPPQAMHSRGWIPGRKRGNSLPLTRRYRNFLPRLCNLVCSHHYS